MAGRLPVTPVRAVLVTPQRLVAEGLLALAAARDDVSVCGAAGGIAEALVMVAEHEPDVLLIDAALGSTEVCCLLAETRSTRAAALVINAPDDPVAIVRLIEHGARGYTTARDPFEAVVEALLAVMRQEAACSPEVIASVCHRLFRPSRGAGATEPAAAGLTRREREVLALVSGGLSDKQVAHQLGIGLSTVKKHLHHVFEKLAVHRRCDATRHAARTGLLYHPAK